MSDMGMIEKKTCKDCIHNDVCVFLLKVAEMTTAIHFMTEEGVFLIATVCRHHEEKNDNS